MSAITIAGLSVSEAERELVQLWLLLEKHDVASPAVVVTPLLERLDIRLVFTSKADAEMIGLRLKTSAEERELSIP